jgi:hypothetical protein
MIFQTQHQFLDHPKVHSLPLGIKHTKKENVLDLVQARHVPNNQLLMINDNGWRHCKHVTATVIRNTFASWNVSQNHIE